MTRIVCASTRPDLIPTVGRWHWTEWGRYDPDGSLDAWTRSLAARCHADRVPATWIALEDDEPVGSACLVEHDMSTRRDLGPWLAGVFVVPERRGRGVGAALVRRATAEAARFGVERLRGLLPEPRLVGRRYGTVRGTRGHDHGAPPDRSPHPQVASRPEDRRDARGDRARGG